MQDQLNLLSLTAVQFMKSLAKARKEAAAVWAQMVKFRVAEENADRMQRLDDRWNEGSGARC